MVYIKPKTDFYQRISALSPDQLKLLKRRLQKEGIPFEKEIKKLDRALFPPLVPAEKREYYPLSSVQKRMYTLSRMENAGTVYITSSNRTFRENLEEKQVEEVFKTLIARHESLRTSFHFVDGEPVQRIHQEVDFKLECFDVKDELKNFIRPFDLSQAPLFRAGIVKIAEDKYQLIINVHHIITDALSNRILWDEFDGLYHGHQLKQLRIQYPDFSQWFNGDQVKSVVKRQENYWMKEFQGEIPVINLPADYPRPISKSYEGGFRLFRISSPEGLRLKALAFQQNTTLFMVMLSIYLVFLSKISRQKDIIVGLPIAGRRHTGLADAMGMYVNTLALRNDLREEITFTALVQQVKQRTLEAFENQDYSFEDLVNNVVKQRDPSRNPIFDVFFTFRAPGIIQELPDELITGEDSSAREPVEGTTLSMFDLYLMGAERKENIFLVFVYSTKLFNKGTIDRFVGYVKEIISAVSADNQVRLKDINISHDLAVAAQTLLKDEEDDFGF